MCARVTACRAACAAHSRYGSISRCTRWSERGSLGLGRVGMIQERTEPVQTGRGTLSIWLPRTTSHIPLYRHRCCRSCRRSSCATAGECCSILALCAAPRARARRAAARASLARYEDCWRSARGIGACVCCAWAPPAYAYAYGISLARSCALWVPTDRRSPSIRGRPLCVGPRLPDGTMRAPRTYPVSGNLPNLSMVTWQCRLPACPCV